MRQDTSAAIPLQGGVSLSLTHTHTHTDTTYEALHRCPARPDVLVIMAVPRGWMVMVMVMFLLQLRKSRLRKFK